MDYDAALDSLEDGEVTAVLVMPEGFVQGVMNGENPDLELYVSSDRPLESLLTLWLGQSASDLLASVQSGIYAVLEIYGQNPPEGLGFDEVVMRINLRYINWTLNRQKLFRISTVDLTGQLPVDVHYGLSVMCFLMLSAAPLFCPIYDRKWIGSQRRFLAVGRRMECGWLAALGACWLVIFPVFLVGQIILLDGSFGLMLIGAGLCALFCSVYVGFCCLVTSGTGSCGVLSFVWAMGMLLMSGGILPAAMMPESLRRCMDYSPVTWMRGVLAMAVEDAEIRSLWILLTVAVAVLLASGSAVLYHRRGLREEWV